MAFLPIVLAASLIPSGPCVRLPGDDAPRGNLRPVLSGPEQTVETPDGAWIVHWTDQGEDRPAALNDDDGNGLPDGIDAILTGLEIGTASFAEAGYRAVVPDGGGDGTEAIDVYVRQINAFGYAHAQWNSQEDGWSCFIELDPDNSDLGSALASSVAAHEAHHCVQYAYTVDSESWIYEATATYEQYLLFEGPALDLALGVLWNQRLRGMGTAIDTTGDRFEYAGFLLMKHLADRDGDDAPTRVWEQLAAEPDWDAALTRYAQDANDEGFGRAFTWWAVWNLFGCSRDDGLHYDASTHPCILTEVSADVPLLEDAIDRIEFVHDDAPYTAQFAEMSAGGSAESLQLACNVGPSGALAEIALVALDRFGAGGEVAFGRAAGGDVLEVRLVQGVDADGAIALVSTSLGQDPAEIECGFARVPPVSEEGEQCSCSAVRPDPQGGLLLLAPTVLGLRRRRSAG